MTKENLGREERKSFPIEIKSRVHIHGAKADAIRKLRDGLYLPESILMQVDRRVAQSGGRFRFDIAELPIDMKEAAFFYMGAATYAFESNPGYRYSAIRIAARRVLANHNIQPLPTVLRKNGFAVRSEFTLGDIELGSIQFLQKVKLVVSVAAGLATIAANAPTVYQNIEEVYLPAARRISVTASDYIERYFHTLQQSGIDISHETPPIGPPILPDVPAITPRRRIGSNRRSR